MPGRTRMESTWTWSSRDFLTAYRYWKKTLILSRLNQLHCKVQAEHNSCRYNKSVIFSVAGWHLCPFKSKLVEQLLCIRGCIIWLSPSSVHEIQNDARAAWWHLGPPRRRPRLALLYCQRLHWNCQRRCRHGHIGYYTMRVCMSEESSLSLCCFFCLEL